MTISHCQLFYEESLLMKISSVIICNIKLKETERLGEGLGEAGAC